MIEIFHSLDTDSLINKLLENISTENPDPFYSPKIVIPNNNLSKYIELYICEKNEISFNICFNYLENILIELLLKRLDKIEKQEIEFLNNKKNIHILTLLINNLIHEEIEKNEFNIIKKYIGNNKKEKNKKIWQLSEKLSILFREYEYKRSDVIQKWLSNENFYNLPVEDFQRYIYYRIFNKTDGLIKKLPSKFLNLLELFNLAKEKNIKNIEKNTIHIFCVSNISNLHYKIIDYLSEVDDFYFYLLNYSGKYSKNNFISYKLFNLTDQNYYQINNLLKNFSISEIKSTESKNNFLTFFKKTLLSEGIIETEKINYDGCIKIIASGSIFREVETVINSICSNLLNIPDLKLNEIAILVPDINKYLPYFKFHIEKNKILKFNLTDSNALIDSNYGKALLKLLEIFNENLTRKNCFELFFNDCFLKKFNLTKEEITVWQKLTLYSNIYNDFDEKSQFSFSKGINRILLGKIMELDEEDLKSYINNVPLELNIIDGELLDKFIQIIDDLKKKKEEIKKIENTPELLLKIIEIADEYLEVNFENKFELIVKATIKETLLRDYKYLNYYGGFFLTIEVLLEYISSILESIGSTKGSYLTNGINISPILPMRPIPFKIIYILGLNEKDFPGKDEQSTINLINLETRTGDLKKSEINLISLLEVLFSAKEKIYLSYIEKDLEKDAELYPSPILEHIVSFINEELLKENRLTIIKTPLNSESLEFLNETLYPDVICNFNYNDKLLMLKKLQSKGYQIEGELERATINTKINTILIPEKNPKKISEKIILSIDELVRFLENPLEATITNKLAIYDDKNKDNLFEEEGPFFLNSLFKYKLEKKIIENIVIRKSLDNSLWEQIEKYYDFNTIRGNTPENELGIYYKINLLSQIKNNIDKYFHFLELLKDYNVYLKNSAKFNELPFLNFSFNEVKNYEIEIKADLENLFERNSCYKTLIITNSNEIKNRHLIKPFLYYLFMLYNNIEIKNFNAMIFLKEKVNSFTFNYDKEFAKEYLTLLINDYLSPEACCNNIPIDIIDKNIIKNLDNFSEEELKNEFMKKIKKAEEDEFTTINSTESYFLIKNRIPNNIKSTIKNRLLPILKIIFMENFNE